MAKAAKKRNVVRGARSEVLAGRRSEFTPRAPVMWNEKPSSGFF